MGSPLNIVFVARDSVEARILSEKCFALVDSFNLIYSDYDPNSELSRLNALSGKGKQYVSPAMLDILLASQKAYQQSNGAYDISIGPLSMVWRKARKTKLFPDSSSVIKARHLIGLSRIRIDSPHHSILMPVEGMRLDLGGIAKGYVAQKIVDFLKEQGIKQSLVDAGGDMAMGDPPNTSQGWIVGVNVPETTDELLSGYLILHNMAVATSGDAYQYIAHNGKKYSHIIDPRTGYGIQSQRNVTVIAKNGTDADWLATACSILPIAVAKELAIRNQAALLITVIREGKIVYYKTSHFDYYWKRGK